MDSELVSLYIMFIVFPSIVWRLIVIPEETPKSTRSGASIILGMVLLIGVYGFTTEFIDATTTQDRLTDGIWLILVAIALMLNVLAWIKHRKNNINND